MKKVLQRGLLMFTAVITLFFAAPMMALSAGAIDWNLETVDNNGSVGEFTSIAVDSDNDPHISYYDRGLGDLKYASKNGSKWYIQTVDTDGNSGWTTSLALDANDDPLISYYESTKGDLKYAAWDGAQWVIQTVDSVGDVGSYTSLALDSMGRPRISYFDNTNQKLKYAAWNGSSWVIEVVDDSRLGYSSMAIDAAGYAHISYSGSTGALKYASQRGTSWDIATVEGSGDYGMYTSLVLDSGSRPHITYCNRASTRQIKYAYWDGSSWIKQTIDGSGNVSIGANSLTLDGYGNPRVTYDGSRGLRYAHWTGVEWSKYDVNTDGGGDYPSIALDTNNNIYISFWGDSVWSPGKKTLRYAGASLPPVWPEPSLEPGEGTYAGFQTVSMHKYDPGSEYYTVDGTDPRSSSSREEVGFYEGYIRIDSSNTLRAVAYNGYIYGPVATAYYEITPFPSPELSPVSGSYPNPLSVSITNLPESNMQPYGWSWEAYYTLDGTNPTTSTTARKYSGSPFSLDSSKVVKVAFLKTCHGMIYAGSSPSSSILGTGWGPVATFSYEIVESTYKVHYIGNGNTSGSVPIDNNSYWPRDTVTVLGNYGELARTGYTFDGWNTSADGRGTRYEPGKRFTIGTANVTLYAEWILVAYDTEDFVDRFYVLCLARSASASELAYWVNKLDAGTVTGADLAYGFIFSDEFTGRDLPNGDYLDVLYAAFFNRAPDGAGYSYWLGRLDGGTSRLVVLAGFVNSAEFSQICADYGIIRGSIEVSKEQIAAFVTRFYEECLGRQPDQDGLAYWVDELAGGTQTGADIAYGFVFSGEFQGLDLTDEDYLDVLFTAFFDREPDTAGLNYWLGRLDAGTTRLQVLAGFVNSAEFAALCSEYGIEPGAING